MKKQKENVKKVLILSDTHCGHGLGLTPPKYQSGFFEEIQNIGWSWFLSKIKKLGIIDILILNGDIIDGPGHKGNRQHITTDIKQQQEIFKEVMKFVKPKKMIFFRGTPFHVETDQENEDNIAEFYNSEIYDSGKVDINGLIMHCRHTTGKGGTAYGSITSAQRSAVVQTLLDDIGEDNQHAKIYIRSHIHEYIKLERSLFTLITTPCLQFAGTSYGRKCTGFYDYGFVSMEIKNKNDYTIKTHLIDNPRGEQKGVIKL